MKLEVRNGILTITKPYRGSENLVEVVLEVDAKELAKALKPYLDSIDNCECKGCKR